jgi:hypothetical protein
VHIIVGDAINLNGSDTPGFYHIVIKNPLQFHLVVHMQQNLIAEIKTHAPNITDTCWVPMSKVSNWVN